MLLASRAGKVVIGLLFLAPLSLIFYHLIKRYFFDFKTSLIALNPM
jgi:hypothetical protein